MGFTNGVMGYSYFASVQNTSDSLSVCVKFKFKLYSNIIWLPDLVLNTLKGIFSDSNNIFL